MVCQEWMSTDDDSHDDDDDDDDDDDVAVLLACRRKVQRLLQHEWHTRYRFIVIHDI